jgi:hypothetical protein
MEKPTDIETSPGVSNNSVQDSKTNKVPETEKPM